MTSYLSSTALTFFLQAYAAEKRSVVPFSLLLFKTTRKTHAIVARLKQFYPIKHNVNPQMGQKSNSNHFETPTLGLCTWSNPGRFTAGKPHFTNCTGGWVESQGPSGRMRKISPPLAFEPRTVQPVTSCKFYFIRNESIRYILITFVQD